MKPDARLAMAVILNLVLLAFSTFAQTVTSPAQMANTVDVQNVELRGDTISGVVINKSAHELRDVRLLVRYTWLWKNERHPGGNSPGRAEYYTVPARVPANGKAPFSFQLKSPLPKRADGEFEPLVEVVSYTELGA